MREFQDSLHGLLNWFLDARSRSLDTEGEHRAPALADHIAAGYRVLEPAPNDAATVVKDGRPIDIDAYLAEDGAYRAPVGRIHEAANGPMREFVSHFFLHGSLATLDYARGWSDVDTFVVLRRDTVISGKRLAAFRRLAMEIWPVFRQITPLQHHGLIVAAEPDLADYASSYLPLAVFDHTLNLLDDQPLLTLRPRPGNAGGVGGLIGRRDVLREAVRTGIFKHHPLEGRYLMSHFQNADDSMFQLFCLLGYVMTVPAYYMDATGRGCYKGDSFARARPEISDTAWAIVDRASRIRTLWAEKEGTAYTGNAVPGWLRDILGPEYIADALRLIEEVIEKARAFEPERQEAPG